MRNTVEYPITKDEIVDCLREFITECVQGKTGLIGDIRPILLQKAIDIIQTGTFDPS